MSALDLCKVEKFLDALPLAAKTLLVGSCREMLYALRQSIEEHACIKDRPSYFTRIKKMHMRKEPKENPNLHYVKELVLGNDWSFFAMVPPLPDGLLRFCNSPVVDDMLMTEALPNSITCLRLPGEFNKAVVSWPKSLQCLMLGSAFNKPLFNLPNTLVTLRVGDSFNETFYPPTSLQSLVLGNAFNQPMHRSFPSLQRLVLTGSAFDKSLSRLDAPRLRLLALGLGYDLPLCNLPCTLEVLDLTRCLRLDLSACLSSIEACPALLTLTLPDGAEARSDLREGPASLRFTEHPELLIPPCVTRLCCGEYFNGPLQGALPPSLRLLSLSLMYNYPFESKYFPPTLEGLVMNCPSYSHPLDDLPRNLLFLSLNVPSRFHPLLNLPDSLQALFSYGILPEDSFPPGLRTLEYQRSRMPPHYNLPKSVPAFPETLQHLLFEFIPSVALPRIPASVRTLWLLTPTKSPVQDPIALPPYLHELAIRGCFPNLGAVSPHLDAFVLLARESTAPNLSVLGTRKIELFVHADIEEVELVEFGDLFFSGHSVRRLEHSPLNLFRCFTSVDSYLATPGVPVMPRRGDGLECPCGGFEPMCANYKHRGPEDVCVLSL